MYTVAATILTDIAYARTSKYQGTAKCVQISRRRRATWHSLVIMCAEIINDHYRGADARKTERHTYIYIYICTPWLKRLPRTMYELIFICESAHCDTRPAYTIQYIPRRFVNQREWSMIERYPGYAAQITLAAISAIINCSRVRKSSVDAFSPGG